MPRDGGTRTPIPFQHLDEYAFARFHILPAARLRRMPVEIDIEHVARLARLELSDEEKARLREQLGAILEHAAKVGEVAADDVPPTAYAIPRSNVLRPDEVTPSLAVEEVLSNAPEVEDDRFKVPKIVEVE